MSHKVDLDLEALADLAVPREVRLSPDGSRIVYSVKPFTQKSERTVSTLWIAETGKENSARQFTSGLFNDESPQWSEDGTSIAFKSDRASPGKSVAIYVIPADGGEACAVTPIQNERHIAKFAWAPAAAQLGNYIAYLSADEKTDEQKDKEKEKDDAKVWGEKWNYRRLRRVDVLTQEVETLVGGDKHVHDFSWGCWSGTGQRIVYIEHDTPDINSPGFHGAKIKIWPGPWVQMANVPALDESELLSFPGPITSLEWAFHNRNIYFIAGASPTSCSTSQTLYEFKMQHNFKGERVRKVFEDSRCCLDLHKNFSTIVFKTQTPLCDEVYLLYYKRHFDAPWEVQPKVRYSNLDSNRCEIAAFDAIYADPHWTWAGHAITAMITSDSAHPNELFSKGKKADKQVVEPEDSRVVQLSNHNSTISSLNISQFLSIQTKASDGYDLDGVFFYPTAHDPKDGPLPTILWPHGGPYGRITNSFSVYLYYEVPLLVSRGYAVLCPNYRGGSGRGQEHAEYARGKVGTVDYSDCIAILQQGIEQGLVDASKVIIGGWSQGGFLSYLAITRPDFKFRGAICGAGVVDWDMMTMTSDAYWFEADLAGGAPWDVDAVSGEPQEAGTQLPDNTKRWVKETAGRRGSAIWHMRNVDTPVLILHGENDVRVPFSQAVAFYRACLHNNVPVKMVSYPREGHWFTERAHIIDLWKRILEFCELHLS